MPSRSGWHQNWVTFIWIFGHRWYLNFTCCWGEAFTGVCAHTHTHAYALKLGPGTPKELPKESLRPQEKIWVYKAQVTRKTTSHYFSDFSPINVQHILSISTLHLTPHVVLRIQIISPLLSIYIQKSLFIFQGLDKMIYFSCRLTPSIFLYILPAKLAVVFSSHCLS